MNEITRLTSAELAKRIRSRELTAEAVVSAFLARIEEVNPQINAIVQ